MPIVHLSLSRSFCLKIVNCGKLFLAVITSITMTSFLSAPVVNKHTSLSYFTHHNFSSHFHEYQFLLVFLIYDSNYWFVSLRCIPKVETPTRYLYSVQQLLAERRCYSQIQALHSHQSYHTTSTIFEIYIFICFMISCPLI